MISAPSPPPPSRIQTVEEIPQSIERLKRRLIDISNVDMSDHNAKIQLQENIMSTLGQVFGSGSNDYKRFIGAASIGFIFQEYNNIENPDKSKQDYDAFIQSKYITMKGQCIEFMEKAILYLESEYDELTEIRKNIAHFNTSTLARSQKVFVVHGHDDGARESVARFLEKIGLQAVILSEQSNQGQTIIEKFEANSDSGFAVVLMMPDDVGGKSGGTMLPRARQNVVFELGYFIGKLGRRKVLALTRGNVEIPSDYVGVVYQPYDATGGWKIALGKELQAAGYDIDWNKVHK